jgi:L-fucose mutarotase/ribose pyranase (RbsD/FucU family)
MIKIMLTNVICIVLLSGCTSSCWQSRLKQELPVYGHRNWIVVADSAYPKQSAPGIETLYTGKGQIEVLETVLKAIEASGHVRPIVMIDAELDSVDEADAPGVDAYRKQLKELLKDRQVKVMPHEEIIRKLDKGAELFNILLLKTDLAIPYTSVFLELDCGYWNAEKELRLRRAMGSPK